MGSPPDTHMANKDRFVVEVPNKDYDGYRYGVKFSQGRATVHTAEERDVLVNDHGYKEITTEE